MNVRKEIELGIVEYNNRFELPKFPEYNFIREQTLEELEEEYNGERDQLSEIGNLGMILWRWQNNCQSIRTKHCFRYD